MSVLTILMLFCLTPPVLVLLMASFLIRRGNPDRKGFLAALGDPSHNQHLPARMGFLIVIAAIWQMAFIILVFTVIGVLLP